MSESRGEFLEACDDRDRAYEIASEIAERLHDLKIYGRLVGVRQVNPRLFYIEMYGEPYTGIPDQQGPVD